MGTFIATFLVLLAVMMMWIAVDRWAERNREPSTIRDQCKEDIEHCSSCGLKGICKGTD